MSLREQVAAAGLLRGMVVPMLRRTSFDFTIAHPWVEGARVKLNSYRHKGYWFYRRERELESMELFAALIGPGDHVVEVGGHIGFITGHFARLAADHGRVTVFEPGSNNLPYIRHNIAALRAVPQLAAIELKEKAVGPEAGVATLYEDDLTGQNNSLIRNFDGLAGNARNAHVAVEVKAREVELVAIDDELAAARIDFIKIDVEGFELGVLTGMARTLADKRPLVMVEVQASRSEILDLFEVAGYRLFNEQRREVTEADAVNGNMFALHREAHVGQLQHFQPSIRA